MEPDETATTADDDDVVTANANISQTLSLTHAIIRTLTHSKSTESQSFFPRARTTAQHHTCGPGLTGGRGFVSVSMCICGQTCDCVIDEVRCVHTCVIIMSRVQNIQ